MGDSRFLWSKVINQHMKSRGHCNWGSRVRFPGNICYFASKAVHLWHVFMAFNLITNFRSSFIRSLQDAVIMNFLHFFFLCRKNLQRPFLVLESRTLYSTWYPWHSLVAECNKMPWNKFGLLNYCKQSEIICWLYSPSWVSIQIACMLIEIFRVYLSSLQVSAAKSSFLEGVRWFLLFSKPNS